MPEEFRPQIEGIRSTLESVRTAETHHNGPSRHLAQGATYFGLAEDERYVDDDGGQLRARGRTRGAIPRRASRSAASASRKRDEIDDIFADDSPAGASSTRVLRPVGNGRTGEQVRVHLVIPKNFNDAQQIADKFKDSVPVILNLQGADTDLSKRLIDFASGLTYALDGGMQRIADKVFLLTPRNVEVSAEERARLLEKGFFNQS